jgi:hypothetical protein
MSPENADYQNSKYESYIMSPADKPCIDSVLKVTERPRKDNLVCVCMCVCVCVCV